jgi:hypothetical protein
MSQIVISLDDRQVVRLFQRAPGAVTLRLRQLIEGAAIDIQREMRIRAGVGVTTRLRTIMHYSRAAVSGL